MSITSSTTLSGSGSGGGGGGGGSSSTFGADFGQKLSLTTRIREILRDYPEGTSILSEIIQNADDAGAREISFCLDCRTHGMYIHIYMHNIYIHTHIHINIHTYTHTHTHTHTYTHTYIHTYIYIQPLRTLTLDRSME